MNETDIRRINETAYSQAVLHIAQTFSEEDKEFFALYLSKKVQHAKDTNAKYKIDEKANN